MLSAALSFHNSQREFVLLLFVFCACLYSELLHMEDVVIHVNPTTIKLKICPTNLKILSIS